MKQIIFTLCILVAFITSANAGEYYNCVDQDGNTVLTTTPQDGMKCEMKGEYEDKVPRKKDGCDLITKKMSQLNVKKILGSPFHSVVDPRGGAYFETWTYTNVGAEDCIIEFFCAAGDCSVSEVKRQKDK